MKNTLKIISCYSADTAGVCSILYEMGGMVVVHDASGCNSTYSTHDEPRWSKYPSNIFISALTERDAIMGRDETLIDNTVKAAKELEPRFICLCGSPMPALIGTDFYALASEIEKKTSIPTFSVATTGTYSYIQGAGLALKEFIIKTSVYKKREENTVNILGYTPLDLYINGQKERIVKLFEDKGIKVNFSSEYSKNILNASHNLVVSQSGMEAAKYMWENYDIPYMCALPIGEKLSKFVLDIPNIKEPVFLERNTAKTSFYILGESLFSQSLAKALSLEEGIDAGVVYTLEKEDRAAAPCDCTTSTEEDTENFLKEKAENIIADPIYKHISPVNAKFMSLPHFAFSGRCFEHNIPNLMCDDHALKEVIK